MDFNQVRYFLALSETLNFTRAAEQCHVSQPALTQGLKRLEPELGGDLIQRKGRLTELTELGKALRIHFEQINRTRHLVQMTAKALLSGEIAEINIGVMCTLGPQLLSGFLDVFRMNHPMVSLVLHDVVPSTVESLLLSGSLDAVFCANESSNNPRLNYMELFRERFVVALPADHPLMAFREVPFQELAKHPYLDRLHCEFRQTTFDSARDQNVSLNVVISSEREDWIQSLVKKGAGISLIPRGSLVIPDLDYRPVTDPEITRVVKLAVPKVPETPPALERLIHQTMNYEWPSPDSP